MVIGSQALRVAIDTVKNRLEDFESQKVIAASTDITESRL